MPPNPFDAAGRPRPAYRPIAAPLRRRRTSGAVVVSFLLHLALVLAVFLPPVIASQLDLPLSAGAGGATPAGGGGGGNRGSGAEQVIPERITYFQVAPAPAPAPVPTPVERPPEPPKPKPPEVPPPAPATAPAEPAPVRAPVQGTGGGTGADRSGGSGPGSGGGVGSGVGTGRGTATGPGTGGGGEEIYPPEVTTMVMLPQPVPRKIRPYTMVAWFDVDERGRATLLAFNPSKDGAYNRRLREVLAEWRFRPAVRADGTPVRDTISVTAAVP